ncbi:carboxymuconolactone decarboxylase family protein [Streptomyces brasiliensis]|uniref:Carboxymuconolactone decarboxylase-like domain-containing protein n=1 Tax=Streptomyces brasiliensis TaxID=1954 RepID=A0A917NW16_9ACTN|nr:carboxymuconolactone decarboxylase family protein [Streptomyces brasiliensis]GGJ34726.1 hypothetical protein GCM10010121_052450 [Streptomyces brasiliensis]
MSRIARHTPETAPELSRQALAALAFPNGKILNFFAHMAASPAVLQGYVALQSVIEDYGTLDARTREAIALAVANQDHCDYCQAAHTLTGKQAGLTQEQTIAIRRGEVDFDPKSARCWPWLARLPPTSASSTTTRGKPPSRPGGPMRNWPSSTSTSP